MSNPTKLTGVGVMTPNVLPKVKGKRFRGLALLLQFGDPNRRISISLTVLSGTIDQQRPCVLSVRSQSRVKRQVRFAGVRTNDTDLWPLVNKAVLSCALDIYIK